MAEILFSTFEDAEYDAKYSEPLDEDLHEPHPVIDLIISSELDEPPLIPGLLIDLERRASLQLECLRRFPFLQTACCKAPLCFKCKTMYHHPGETCEERMKEEIGDGRVQCCPSCGVPTVKVEACDHIICVCGQSWDWESGQCQSENDY